jgi:A/G-specific adenine glycosylase
VDGNVHRVLSRVFGIATPIDSTAGKREFRDRATRLIDTDHPGDHNQAVMELGATVCLPRNPKCGECPLATRCVARKEDRTGLLPVKARRTEVRLRHFNYLWIEDRSGVRFTRRDGRDIWQGLYELPLVETTAPGRPRDLGRTVARAAFQRIAGPVDHLLSHQRIRAVLWKVEGDHRTLPAGWERVKRKDIDRLAVHRLMERLLESMP